MVVPVLSKDSVREIQRHVSEHAMSVAIIRTEASPADLRHLLQKLADTCGLSVTRMNSTPAEDYGFAELTSKERILVVLWVGAKGTEFVSVSETDEAAVKELEESIRSSNFHSEIIRQGT
jgi:hypothetical protein